MDTTSPVREQEQVQERKRDRERRRILPSIGLLLAVLILLYLIVSWLRAAGRPARSTSQLELDGAWVVFQPVWLYPVTLLTVILLLFAWVAYPVAARLASRASWRELVLVQAGFALRQLEILCAGGGPDCAERNSAYAATRYHLKEAEQAARWQPRSPRWRIEQLCDAWTGASIECAFRNLHAAEVAMVPLLAEDELRARVPEVLARLRKCADSDPRKRAARRFLREETKLPRLRVEYATALRYGLEVKDTEHVRVREFRNILLSATAALSMVVAVLCVVGATFPDATPLCFAPPTAAPLRSERRRRPSIARRTPSAPPRSNRRAPGPRPVGFRLLATSPWWPSSG